MFGVDVAVRDLAEERASLELRFTLTVLRWWRARAWEADGARSPVAWLRWRCGLDESDGRRLVRRVRLLDAVAEVHDAVDAGLVPIAHLDVLASAVTDERVELARRDATELIAAAKELDLVGYRRYIAHWRSLADDTLARADELDARSRRYLRASRSLFGEVLIDGRLDAESGQRVLAALDAATTPDHDEEPRTPAQRRADALVRLAETGTGDRTAAATPSTLVVSVDVLAGAAPTPSSVAELDAVGLTRDAVLRHGCDSSVVRVLTAGSGEVIDVGRSTRVVSPSLRRALVVRDRHCRFPGCDVDHRRCDAHHLVHWAHGGRTELANLRLLCAFHHRLVHDGGWRIRAGPDGSVIAVRPDGSVVLS
ncbi:MAG: DUF222 domain-containing protein [Actinomycetota bacterium]